MGFELAVSSRGSYLRALISAVESGLLSTNDGVCTDRVYRYGCVELVNVFKHIVLLHAVPGFYVYPVANAINIVWPPRGRVCTIDLEYWAYEGEMCSRFAEPEVVEEVLRRLAEVTYTLLVFLSERLRHVADEETFRGWVDSAAELAGMGATLDLDLYNKLDKLSKSLKLRLLRVKTKPPSQIYERLLRKCPAGGTVKVMFDHHPSVDHIIAVVYDTTAPNIAVELWYLEKGNDRYVVVGPSYYPLSGVVSANIDKAVELPRNVEKILEDVAGRGGECSDLAKAWLELLRNSELVEEIP